jgi:tripartite-type tricarboxylate transporter receptor subunit TctC
VLVWQALFVPKGTPPEVKTRLAAAMQAALKDPSVVELAKRINTPLFWKGAEETAALIRADEQALRPVMESLGLIKH